MMKKPKKPPSWKKLQIIHDILILLPWLRNRLRCPNCSAVGTWKPHGGKFYKNEYKVKRWLCKCCGFFMNGKVIKMIRGKGDVWCEEGLDRTPFEMLKVDSGHVWPWLG